MTETKDYFNLFESTLRRRDYSEKTVIAYLSSLRMLAEQFPGRAIETISPAEIRKFFEILINRKKVSTSALYIAQSAFALFYDDILEKDYRVKTIIKLPKRTRPIPEILSQNEVIALINSSETAWQKLVFSLIYATGMEVNEAASIRINDIDLTNKVLKIRQGRGKSSRQVNLSDYVCQLLTEFIKHNRGKEWLFEGQQQFTHISKDAVQRSFKKNLKLAGISKKVTAKSLRYAHVKHLESFGVPIRNVLINLGIYSGQSLQLFSEIDGADDIQVPDPLDFLLDGKSFKLSTTNKTKHKENIVINLDFVADNDLLEILRRDIDELNVVLTQGLEKAVKTSMVLCGSIAETMLLDSLLQRENEAVAQSANLPKKISSNLIDWDLHDMVFVATHLNPPLLPDDAISGASQLRQWRNFIHPGRELKEAKNKRIKPSVARARSAIEFMRFIADELGRK